MRTEIPAHKWIRNGIYLLIALIAFSFSLFKWDSQVWIAAWIAPVLLLRFTRNNKWATAIVFGFLILLISYIFGFLPAFRSFNIEGDVKNMIFIYALNFVVAALTALLFLVPFILDKAFYKKLPKSISSLIFPCGFISIELLSSFFQGTLISLGQSQYALSPIVMISSIVGMLGISFLIAWFASIINSLWEEKWDIKKLGLTGSVYAIVMLVLLVFGATILVFPKTADTNVMIAGITLDAQFSERLADYNFMDSSDTNPTEYAHKLSSPQSHIDEMRNKTIKAIKAGAKIIVWQEYALTLESSDADALLLELRNLADREDVYLVVAYARVLNEKEKKDKILRNLAVLFTPEGHIGWEYDKAHPIVGEYLISNPGPRNIPYIDTPYGRIGQVICFDMHFPDYLRQASTKNIDIILSSSVDENAFTPLHTYNGGYRAVENGFTLVRIVGDGQSAVIDPYFRFWARQDTFEQGNDNFYYNVPVISGKTIYGSIGFIFPYAMVLLLISLIMFSIIRSVKNR